MKDTQFAKLVVFVNSAVPLALLSYDAWLHRLGANPVNFALRTTGMLALVFLLLSLTVTPLRKFTGRNWFSNFRKMLGLYGFCYACLHFLIYFALQRQFNLRATFTDITKRWFILIGMSALIMLIPLAITSTNGMIKRLGAYRWKQLHKLAYFAAAAGAIHYYMSVKADTRLPIALGTALAILLLYRVVGDHLPTLKKTRPAPRPA